MRRPSGQFAVVVFVVLLVIEAAGVETLIGWHAAAARLRRGPGGTPILDDLVNVVIEILEVVKIALGRWLGGSFLGLASATAATSTASAATAPLVVVVTGSGFSTFARRGSVLKGRGSVIGKFGVEFSTEIGAGTGFVELKLTVRGRKLIPIGAFRRSSATRFA